MKLCQNESVFMAVPNATVLAPMYTRFGSHLLNVASIGTAVKMHFPFHF